MIRTLLLGAGALLVAAIIGFGATAAVLALVPSDQAGTEQPLEPLVGELATTTPTPTPSPSPSKTPTNDSTVTPVAPNQPDDADNNDELSDDPSDDVNDDTDDSSDDDD